MAFTGKFLYMAHHFILQLLIPFDLRLSGMNGGLSTLCHNCSFACQQRMLKKSPRPAYLCCKDEVVWLWHLLVNLYIWLTISSCCGWIPLTLGLAGRDGDLSTLCRSCGFACQQRVLKAFPDPGYHRFNDEVVWLWHSLVNLYMWLTISSCYDSIPLILRLSGRDGGLSTLCHNCGFVCPQVVLKMFPGSGYVCSEDEVIWLWHSLVNLYIWLSIWSCYGSIALNLGLLERDGGLSTLCHNCGFACQKRVLKTFPDARYLHSEDEVVWLWHSVVNFLMWLTISSFYGSLPLTLELLGRNGGLRTLCRSCGFACQQRVLKASAGPERRLL